MFWSLLELHPSQFIQLLRETNFLSPATIDSPFVTQADERAIHFSSKIGIQRRLHPDVRSAGVSVLVVPPRYGDVDVSFVLCQKETQRKDLPFHCHTDQLVWPGGMVKDSELPSATALRELREEVSLCDETDIFSPEIEFISSMPPVTIRISNIKMFPFIHLLDTSELGSEFTWCSGDIDEIVDVASFGLRELIEAYNPRGVTARSDRLEIGPTFEIEYRLDETLTSGCGEQIWGGTARVLAYLLDCVEKEYENQATQQSANQHF